MDASKGGVAWSIDFSTVKNSPPHVQDQRLEDSQPQEYAPPLSADKQAEAALAPTAAQGSTAPSASTPSKYEAREAAFSSTNFDNLSSMSEPVAKTIAEASLSRARSKASPSRDVIRDEEAAKEIGLEGMRKLLEEERAARKKEYLKYQERLAEEQRIAAEREGRLKQQLDAATSSRGGAPSSPTASEAVAEASDRSPSKPPELPWAPPETSAYQPVPLFTPRGASVPRPRLEGGPLDLHALNTAAMTVAANAAAQAVAQQGKAEVEAARAAGFQEGQALQAHNAALMQVEKEADERHRLGEWRFRKSIKETWRTRANYMTPQMAERWDELISDREAENVRHATLGPQVLPPDMPPPAPPSAIPPPPLGQVLVPLDPVHARAHEDYHEAQAMRQQRRRMVEHTTAEIGAILAHRSISPHKSPPPQPPQGPLLAAPPGSPPPSAVPPQAMPPPHGYAPPASPEFARSRTGAMQAGLSAMAEARKANELCSQASRRAPSPRGQRPFLPPTTSYAPLPPRQPSPGPQRPPPMPPAVNPVGYANFNHTAAAVHAERTAEFWNAGQAQLAAANSAQRHTKELDDQMWAEALANANAQVQAMQESEAERARMLGLGSVSHAPVGTHLPPAQPHEPLLPVVPPPLPAGMPTAPGHSPRPPYVAPERPTPGAEPFGSTPHRLASSGAGIKSPAGGLVDQSDASLPSWARGDSQARGGSQASKTSPPQAQGRWAGSQSRAPAGGSPGSPKQGVPRPKYT